MLRAGTESGWGHFRHALCVRRPEQSESVWSAGATANWRFYTGTREASAAVQNAFGVFSRDKMNHPVATFYRAAPNRDWVRIDGFASSADLENELRASSNPKLTK